MGALEYCNQSTRSNRDDRICDHIEGVFIEPGNTIDWERGNFRVTTCSFLTTGVKEGVIPERVVVYGLTKIIGISENYQYLNQLVNSTMTAIHQRGCAYLYSHNNGKYNGAMVALTKEDVAMFRYIGQDSVTDFNKGEDIDLEPERK